MTVPSWKFILAKFTLIRDFTAKYPRTPRSDRYCCLLALSFVLAMVTSLGAQETKDNQFCLGCHSDQSIVSGKGPSVYVDTSIIGASVHKTPTCLDCHDQPGANFDEAPHFQTYKPVDCQSCHQLEGTAWMEYFYKMLKKRGEKEIPDCKECHGTHNAQKELSMKLVCDRCHQEIADKYRQSYHFQKYQEDTRKYPICTTCHDAHFKSKKEVMTDKEYKQEIVDICSKCHQRDIETYIHSRHYHEMEAGNAKAPVCTSCHEKHDIRKPSDPLSRVNPMNISNVCNTCHPGHKESLHRGPGIDPTTISCATCHTGHQTDMASINNSIFKEGGIVNRCNICHSSERHTKENLAHGQLMLLADEWSGGKLHTVPRLSLESTRSGQRDGQTQAHRMHQLSRSGEPRLQKLDSWSGSRTGDYGCPDLHDLSR